MEHAIQKPEGATVDRAICKATLRGAHAFDRSHRPVSLAPGRSAREIARLSWRLLYALVNVFLLVAVIYIVSVKLGSPYTIGLDKQKIPCLPWRVFLLDARPPARIAVDDLVSFRAGAIGQGLDGELLVKKVRGIPGDKIEIKDDVLYINKEPIDKMWLMKTLGKAPGSLDKSYTVPADSYFVVGTARVAYDSRYWGVIHRKQVTGSARPLL